MTDADLIAKHRRGEVVTDDDKIATLKTDEDLDGYLMGWKHIGGITGEIVAKVMERRRQINSRRG